MATIDDVIAWAGTLPGWQADAVRRLLNTGDEKLDEADYSEIAALAKVELGLAPAIDGLKAVPPTLASFSGSISNDAACTLEAIFDVQNVNIIDSSQKLSFANSGITVVYGANGSGKSGYSRILKLACRARDKDEKILPNVFASGPLGKPSATLRINVNGKTEDIIWKLGDTSKSMLSHIAVFDGRCARVITDNRNEIGYLPYGCDIFQKLAATVSRIKGEIEADISVPPPIQDSAVGQETAAAAFLRSLSDTTDVAAIEAATQWLTTDDMRVVECLDLARTSDASNSAKEIERLLKTKERVEAAIKAVTGVAKECEALSNDVIEQTLSKLTAAALAHSIAMEERQTPEPLTGVGVTNPWLLLYQAAKRYSEEIAYSDRSFPALENSVCVLCQQPLGADAVERFIRFKRFMEDVTTGVLESAREAHQLVRRKVEGLSILPDVALAAHCDALRELSQQAADSLRSQQTAILQRKEAILEILKEGASADKVSTLPPWPEPVESLLEEAKKTLTGRIDAISTTSKPDERRKLTEEIGALQSKKALHARRVDIEAFVSSAKRNARLRQAASSLRTQEITRQGTAVIRKNLTPELLKAFKDELSALGAVRVPISVKPIGSAGETSHEMLLEGAIVSGSARPSHILSEGEARVTAIAGFLAELRLAPHANPVVFDDPVSSLDHVFARKVAARLTREGLNRQVIVFTHNIAFLMELNDASTALAQSGSPVTTQIQTIRRGSVSAGITAAGEPWHAMKVGSRVNHLQHLLRDVQSSYQDGTNVYNENAAQIYGLLREAWEAFVEEEWLYGVVSRYRNSVHTLRLMEIEIADSDVHLFNMNMSKASTWMTGHDKSKALHDDRPAPDELLADINALGALAKKVKNARDDTKKRRENQLKPVGFTGGP